MMGEYPVERLESALRSGNMAAVTEALEALKAEAFEGGGYGLDELESAVVSAALEGCFLSMESDGGFNVFTLNYILPFDSIYLPLAGAKFQRGEYRTEKTANWMGAVFLVADKGEIPGIRVGKDPAVISTDKNGMQVPLYAALGKNGKPITVSDVVSATLDKTYKWVREALGLADDGLSNGPLIIRNGKAFTESMRGRKREAPWFSGDAYTIDLGELKISSSNGKELDTALGGNKTLIQLNALATASGYKFEKGRSCEIETTVTDLIAQRGGDVKSRKLRRRIKDELKSLSLTTWVFEGDNGNFLTVPLSSGCLVDRDRVSFSFSDLYMFAVLNRAAGRLPLDRTLLTTNEKNNPNATALGFKLATHAYQNAGKANESTISVKKLLDYAGGIPKYGEVKSTDRRYTARIIQPLERDLNHLVEIGFLDWWEYSHENGRPLTDAEQAARLDAQGNDVPLPYDIAIECNIQWQLAEEFPEQMAETKAARDKKRAEAESAKQREADRKKRIARKRERYIAKKEAAKEAGEK